MHAAPFIRDPLIDQMRQRLTAHPLYEVLGSLDNLRALMEHHVFAVWDFMSIVKSLQRDLTCVVVPWRPSVDAQAARLINEIVLGEETDERPDGSYASHYELYLEAMEEAGADTGPIRQFVEAVSTGRSVSEVLDRSEAPLPARAFVKTTFELLYDAPLHVRGVVLFYGREELIPDMFEAMVERIQALGNPCGKFVYYLKRHIQLDGGEHARMAEGLLRRVCKGETLRREEARQAALKALQARINLWDGILARIHPRQVGMAQGRSAIR
jgi:hypothetical protein